MKGTENFKVHMVRTTRKSLRVSVCGVILLSGLGAQHKHHPNIHKFKSVYKIVFSCSTVMRAELSYIIVLKQCFKYSQEGAAQPHDWALNMWRGWSTCPTPFWPPCFVLYICTHILEINHESIIQYFYCYYLFDFFRLGSLMFVHFYSPSSPLNQSWKYDPFVWYDTNCPTFAVRT